MKLSNFITKRNQLDVFYGKEKVGTLALVGHTTYFEYSKKWLLDGFSISPMSLPLQKKVFQAKWDPFEGLFGVFSDSLPDGWGRLLVDRMLQKYGVDPREIYSLHRLSIVGNSGMGALSYKPNYDVEGDVSAADYDELYRACQKILNTEYSEDLDQLFYLGGSSGGARPKILTTIDDEEWIIKFPSSSDLDNVGAIEYQYSLCARACGIDLPETRLFPSTIGRGYFGVKRFDRNRQGNQRIHMISVSGLLETSHRIPNLDYHLLMKLVLTLTNDFEEVKKMFSLMCFNVFAHNRDDHSKNFSFIYDEKERRWLLSPAYDLTYSYSIGGEHATTVNGNGKNPNLDDILQVAKNIGIPRAYARHTALDIKEKVDCELGDILKSHGKTL